MTSSVFVAEAIIRTVETLAAQKRVLVCPVCDRRLVQIEQMVFLRSTIGCVLAATHALFLLSAMQVFESQGRREQDVVSSEENTPKEEGIIEHWGPSLARAHDNGASAAFGTSAPLRCCHSVLVT